MRNVRVWIGLTVVALVVSGIGVGARAEPKPSDYWVAEFVGGEVSAIGGGGLGFLISVKLFPESNCDLNCRFSRPDLLDLLLMNLGRALGASTGVVLAGASQQVDGNIWGAYLATGIWFADSLLEWYCSNYYNCVWYSSPLLQVNLFVTFIPGIPAALATIGYNIGAKMKSDKSKPAPLGWHLPLISVKF